jgi:hypothetical protein
LSDVNFSLIKLPDFIDKGLSEPAQKVGHTLSSLWELVFGGFETYVQKKQFSRLSDLNEFKKEVEKNIANVPPEKLVEPPLNVIGPTIEASKYYFESPDLRSMFAKLIAASINRDTIKETRSSFVEIIKQLSPLDAQNLMQFKISDQYPIAEYKYIDEKGNYNTQLSNVFLENKSVTDELLNAQSITNIARLGLTRIRYDESYITKSRYEKFKNTSYYKSLCQSIQIGMITNYTKVDVGEGIIRLTPFGKSFIKICI